MTSSEIRLAEREWKKKGKVFTSGARVVLGDGSVRIKGKRGEEVLLAWVAGSVLARVVLSLAERLDVLTTFLGLSVLAATLLPPILISIWPYRRVVVFDATERKVTVQDGGLIHRTRTREVPADEILALDMVKEFRGVSTKNELRLTTVDGEEYLVTLGNYWVNHAELEDELRALLEPWGVVLRSDGRL
jgi:hypothetical protein